MRQFLFVTLIVFMGLLACKTPNPKDDPVLQEAFKIHEQAVKMYKQVNEMLSSTDDLIAEIKGDDTDSTFAARKTTVISDAASLKADLLKWEESLVEVPGFDHDHDHDHGEGGHHHAKIPEHVKKMAPAEMLKLQQSYKLSIDQLNVATQKLLDRLIPLTENKPE